MNILIIDDNRADRRLLSIHLQTIYGNQLNTVEANSLKETNALIEKENWDIIFLDLGLPDSSGIQTVESIISSVPTIPVVVLTGNDNITLARKALRIGAADFIEKDHLTTALLEKTILFAEERHSTRLRIQHHISFLEVLRTIDQVIQQHETTVDILTEICNLLMTVGDYDAIWAINTHEKEQPSISYSGNCSYAKLGEATVKEYHSCHLSQYLSTELAEHEFIIKENYHEVCTSCPLGLDHGQSGFMAVRLHQGGENYGSMVLI